MSEANTEKKQYVRYVHQQSGMIRITILPFACTINAMLQICDKNTEVTNAMKYQMSM